MCSKWGELYEVDVLNRAGIGDVGFMDLYCCCCSLLLLSHACRVELLAGWRLPGSLELHVIWSSPISGITKITKQQIRLQFLRNSLENG